MYKIKLVLIAVMAFALSGCYSSFRTTGYTYGQSDEVVYIDYNFECSHCYYEMYYCFNCGLYHVSINRWCNHHHNWYITWYSYNYHQPYGYYYRHWTQHRYYRDATRHYVRDSYGIRNYRDRKYMDNRKQIGTRKDVKKLTKNYKRKELKEQKKIYKRKDVKKYKTQKREIKKYKAPRNKVQKYKAPRKNVQKYKSPKRNVQKQKVRKQNTQKNTRNNRKTRRK